MGEQDLLIAVHQYVADFYGAHGIGAVSYRSMDETALLAVGWFCRSALVYPKGADGSNVRSTVGRGSQ